MDLDSHEEDLAAREAALGGELKEAKAAAAAVEDAKKELAAKVEQLEKAMKVSAEKVAALILEREKDAHTNSELQVSLSQRGDELKAAKDSIEDLELKVTTLKESLDAARAQETKLKDELRKERTLMESVNKASELFRQTIEVWTEELVSSASNIDQELLALKVEHLIYSPDPDLPHSAKLSLFFRGVAPALAGLRNRIPAQLTEESRRLCAGTLERVLTKIVYRNPGINLRNVLCSLPADADTEALKEQVSHIIAKVAKLGRKEGDRVD